MRLQKYLALCGVASRRRAEQMIHDGLVQLNGATVREMGVKVQEGDRVTVSGKPVIPEREKRYVLYFKPMGEVSTVRDPEGRPTVMRHFKDYPVRLYPVGRLDYDSEGLLLLTNDGELTARLTHPRYQVAKRYLVRVPGAVDREALRQLRSGVPLDNHLTAPAQVRVLKGQEGFTDLLIGIHEGRNRQVRRMLEAVGHKVSRLRRVQLGPLRLGDLPRGQWRELTAQEVGALKRAAGL